MLHRAYYYPFGLPMRSLWDFSADPTSPWPTQTTPTQRYLYNGKELHAELGLGWYDYGARWYDAGVGRWGQVDPLASKYPQWTTYVSVFDNPIIYIDPNGREGIVVSGSPGPHKNKKHFLENGLYKAKAAKKHFQRKGESVTWIVYNDPKGGYTQAELDIYKKKAAKHGITLKVVTSVDEIINYVNNKSGGNSRKEDPITSFYYVGHATPGDLDVGYGGSGEHFDPSDLESEAFSGGCHVNVIGGCRTSVSGWFEDSIVTQFQEILDENSDIYGVNVVKAP